MAKRNKKFTYKSTKRIAAKYSTIIIPLLVKRFSELRNYIDSEDITFDVFCRCADEWLLLKQFSAEYNITLPVDISMDILKHY